jgi:CTP:phosphocholine cytidylyltransferase-like protein
VTWPLVLFLLLPALTHAETAVQAWVQRYNGPGNAEDQATAVAVDGNNDVIITGYSANTVSLYDYDYVTIKYSSAGLPLWTNRYDGPGNYLDRARALAVDGSNNVIVTGESTGSDGGYAYATIKYSSDGVPLWTNRYKGERVTAVAVDGSNNVIVTGRSWASGSSDDYATLKYSSAGVPLWTNRYHGPGSGSDYPTGVAVDGSNNVIVTGYSAGSVGNTDYATVQYSSAGVPLWTNRYHGPGSGTDQAAAVAVDGSNNVIVTGYSGNGSGADYLTILYSSVGVPLWTNRYNGPANNFDSATAVAVDGSNNVIVTGFSAGSGSAWDYTTIQYSSAGVQLWTNRYNGPGNDHDNARKVAVDGNNNVMVTGWSTGSGSAYDYATIKYSSTGVPLWNSRYNGPGNGWDMPVALAVDRSGNVIVTGYSTNDASGYDFATIKYVCVPEPVMTDLSRGHGTFQMRVDDVLQPGTLVIEASTDLAGWAPVFTNTTTTNVLFYTDPDASNAPTRFYRAFQFP